MGVILLPVCLWHGPFCFTHQCLSVHIVYAVYNNNSYTSLCNVSLALYLQYSFNYCDKGMQLINTEFRNVVYVVWYM